MKTFLLQELLLILHLAVLKSCCLTLQGAKTASIQCAAFEVLGDFFFSPVWFLCVRVAVGLQVAFLIQGMLCSVTADDLAWS